ncbi:MAG: hypothetical protein IPM98_14870 [Lewinellaceae bacterium]|nr:hypothetical protein [Lewinellaceae bacterium]
MKQLRFQLACLALLASTACLSAQNMLGYSVSEAGFSAPKDEKEAPRFRDRLWYGGGLSLGFAGGSGVSVFGFGISPMVGYKIIGPLSAGPRLSVFYTSQKYTGIGTYNLFDVELSLFARVRVYKGFFIQGEVGTLSDQYVFFDGSGYGKGTRTRPSQYLGVGYNFSNGAGGLGQEISIMYDFYVGGDINAIENPWQYRFAFTYGF